MVAEFDIPSSSVGTAKDRRRPAPTAPTPHPQEAPCVPAGAPPTSSPTATAGTALLRDGEIVWDGDTIVYVGRRYHGPVDEELDLGEALVMPGLIDLDALTDIDHLVLDSWASQETGGGLLWSQEMDRALSAGAAVVGGIDPCTLDRDPVRHLDIIFDLAERHRAPVGIHLHEPGPLGVFSVDLILERARALGMAGQVTLSHAYDLGGADEATTRRLIEEFAELDIAMATVAPAQHRALPLADLTAAGVRVGLGEDGQRDFWSPYGNGDMLDRPWQLAFTNRYRADELIEHCMAVASRGGASILHPELPRLTSVADRPGVSVGDSADLLLVEGETVVSAVMDRSGDRTVLHAGRVVADGLELVG